MEKSSLPNKTKNISVIVIAVILAVLIMTGVVLFLVCRMNRTSVFDEYMMGYRNDAIVYVLTETDAVERYGEDVSLEVVKTLYQFKNTNGEEAQSEEEFKASVNRVIFYVQVQLGFLKHDYYIVTMERDHQGKLVFTGYEWSDKD